MRPFCPTMVTLLGLLATTLPATAQQRAAHRFPSAAASLAAPAAYAALRTPAALLPPTRLAADSTHDSRLEGLVLFGVPLAVLGGVAGWEMTGDSENGSARRTGTRILAAASGAMLFGGVGAITGALLGGLMPN